MSSAFNRPAASQLAFGLLLAVCAVMILRPAELFPVLDVVPIYEVLIVGALVCGVRDLQRHFRWANLCRDVVLQ